jgi:hypothetical protein
VNGPFKAFLARARLVCGDVSAAEYRVNFVENVLDALSFALLRRTVRAVVLKAGVWPLNPWAPMGNCADIHSLAYTHAHTHTQRIYTYTHSHGHTHIHIHIHIHTHTLTHTLKYVLTYAPTHIHTCIHTHAHIHTYTHTHIHTYTHTHIHTLPHTHTLTHKNTAKRATVCHSYMHDSLVTKCRRPGQQH